MKSYEKHSFYRLFSIFVATYALMFAILASLFFYDSYQTMHNQAVVDANIKQIECLRANLGNCNLNISAVNTHTILIKILYAFITTSIIFIPIAFFLSKYALFPYKKATSIIDSFISNIVHDINSPLSNISLNTSILKTSHSLRAVDRIEGSAKQLISMQHELLSLVSTNTTVKKNHIELKKLIQEIVEDFLNMHKEISIKTSLDSVNIFANEIDIQRIITNLLSNSVKYNRDNNPIKIILTKEYILIEDKGIGIKNPKKVFMINSRERYDIEGSGIGLNAVVNMAKRNNIKIEVSSKVNYGTSIKLLFNNKKVI